MKCHGQFCTRVYIIEHLMEIFIYNELRNKADTYKLLKIPWLHNSTWN